MAEELYDGEFWLPSEILTDDDILTDFFGSGSGSGSGSYSSSEPGSVSSDDELKAPVLLTSPKSTLFGCGSPNRPVSPPKDDQTNNNNNNNNNKKTTLNLLNKAAGEVAKIKGEKSAGTGFFDCSNTSKRNSVPPPSQPARQTFTYFAPPVYYYPQFSPYMNWAPVPVPVQAPPQKQKQEKKASKNKSSSASKKSNEGNNSGINSTLDLSPAAWPPLPGQAKSQPEPQPQPALQTQPMPRTSVGTGVFFPRVIASPATEPEPKMKPDETVNVTKTKKKKGSKRSNSCPVEVNLDDIQLPSEWVY